MQTSAFSPPHTVCAHYGCWMWAATQQLPAYTDFILELFKQRLIFIPLGKKLIGYFSTTQLLPAPLDRFQLSGRRTFIFTALVCGLRPERSVCSVSRNQRVDEIINMTRGSGNCTFHLTISFYFTFEEMNAVNSAALYSRQRKTWRWSLPTAANLTSQNT